MTTYRTHRTIEGIWTVESARIIAGVARIIQDVSIAEDLAQDTLAIAIEKFFLVKNSSTKVKSYEQSRHSSRKTITS